MPSQSRRVCSMFLCILGSWELEAVVTQLSLTDVVELREQLCVCVWEQGWLVLFQTWISDIFSGQSPLFLWLFFSFFFLLFWNWWSHSGVTVGHLWTTSYQPRDSHMSEHNVTHLKNQGQNRQTPKSFTWMTSVTCLDLGVRLPAVLTQNQWDWLFIYQAMLLLNCSR